MKEVFKIEYPVNKAEQKRWTKQYGMNAYYAGKHWSQRQKDAEYWHWMVRGAMDQQSVRKKTFEKPVTITFYWNDRLDIDNHAVMGKFIVDSMKERLIEDDSRKFLKGVSHYFHDEDYILVIVEEIEK